MKFSKSLRAEMPEGGSLYLLKLAPLILISTCSLSISYKSVAVSTYRKNVKRMSIVRWVRIPHCYNFPLLHLCIKYLLTSLLQCVLHSVRWFWSNNNKPAKLTMYQTVKYHIIWREGFERTEPAPFAIVAPFAQQAVTLLNMTAIFLSRVCPQDWKLSEARTELTGSL